MKKTFVTLALILSMIGGVSSSSNSLAQDKGIDINKEVQKKISIMTIEEKVGQMMFFGVDGTKVDPKTINLFEDQHAGGIILYGWRNFWGKGYEDNIKYVNALKKANSQNNSVPLFIGFDEEGGGQSYLPQELLRTPYKGEIGNFNDSSLAEGMATSTAKKLNLLGINTDFGTVLDINTNKDNPIIGIRSYGATKEKVTEFGVKEMKAIEKENVIPTLKHFPGHGDTEVDSHVGLPSLNHDIDRLKNVELAPFQEAINNGADMIMTAHIMLPKIDEEYPATMSKNILTGLLREDMGYKGVVITDDLEMEAIAKNWDLGEAAIKSVEAGSDILLVCHTLENQQKVYNSVLQAVIDGKIDEKRIDESVERILSLKYKYKLSDKALKPTVEDMYSVNNYIYEQLNKYNKKVVENMYK
ncbi:glycoside hydrolase family 3 protein [Clostridium paraputrificum]|uniref:glycoside hydrolase family 3 protein n=1 Tax=Clostridium paraputrificum TaxID=29363 RepID=UPI003D329A4A